MYCKEVVHMPSSSFVTGQRVCRGTICIPFVLPNIQLNSTDNEIAYTRQTQADVNKTTL